jgi:predicted CopG family antitoxin
LSKLIARYFYSPICPEAFKTLERLKNLFQNYDEVIFEYFNPAKEGLESDYSWFPEEMKVIKCIKRKRRQAFFLWQIIYSGQWNQGFSAIA